MNENSFFRNIYFGKSADLNTSMLCIFPIASTASRDPFLLIYDILLKLIMKTFTRKYFFAVTKFKVAFEVLF